MDHVPDPPVGGALLPVIQGFAADRIGILLSFFVPAVCYLYIVYYGLKGHEPVIPAAR